MGNVPGPRHDIVVIGASAGGVEALQELFHAIPQEIDAAIFVVLHLSPSAATVLPRIIDRAARLPARHPEDGEEIAPGTIYVAPPDRHLVLEDGSVRVVRGPKENGHRPAIDVLFRTAARTYRERVCGVILSGSLDDGSVGLRTVRICGGAGLVQDPDEAIYPSMPLNAIAHARPEYVLPVAEIGSTLAELARGEAPPATPDAEREERMDEARFRPSVEDAQPGRRSAYSCPECGGTLWEVEEGDMLRFRCRVGHAYNQASLGAAQSTALEAALWTGLRALEERAALCRRIAGRMTSRGHAGTGSRYEVLADDADRHASVLREVLQNVEAIEEPDAATAEVETAEG